MKKNQAIALYKLAKTLPLSVQLRKHGVFKKGTDFSNKEVKKLKKVNVIIDGESEYKHKVPKVVVINHYKKLKKAYRDHGTKGIQEYIIWLDAHNAKLNKMMENVGGFKKYERIATGLMKAAKGSIVSFWANIIIFLTSFIGAFFLNEKIDDLDFEEGDEEDEMDLTNMSYQEAKEFSIKHDVKIRHRYFMEDEFISFNGPGIISLTEKDVYIEEIYFLETKTSEKWMKSGWSLFSINK